MWRSEDNLSPSIVGFGAPVRVVRFVWLALLPTEPSYWPTPSFLSIQVLGCIRKHPLILVNPLFVNLIRASIFFLITSNTNILGRCTLDSGRSRTLFVA